MPEMISVACDICGQGYRRTLEDLGKKAKCRVCGTTFEIVQKADPDELFDSEDAQDGNPLPWIKGGATSALILMIVFGLGSLLFIPATRRIQSAQAERRVTSQGEDPLLKRHEEMHLRMQTERAKRKQDRERIAAAPPEATKVEEPVIAKQNSAATGAVPAGASVPTVTSKRPVDRDLSGRYQIVETKSTMPGGRLLHPAQRIPGQPMFPPEVLPTPGINPGTRGERSGEMNVQNSFEEKTTWRFKESFGPGGEPPKKP